MNCTHNWTVSSECPKCLRAENHILRDLLRLARSHVEHDTTWLYDSHEWLEDAIDAALENGPRDLLGEIKSLRSLLNRVIHTDDLTGWCGEEASPLYDEICDVLREK